MEVHQGIATDYGQKKFDVTLDETDFDRLSVEYGFTTQATTLQAWLLLTLEAERFVLVQSPKFGSKAEAVIPQIKENREQFAGILAELTGLDLSECRKRAGLSE
jgi:hypothetical protein